MAQVTQSNSGTRNIFKTTVPQSLKDGSIKVRRGHFGQLGVKAERAESRVSQMV